MRKHAKLTVADAVRIYLADRSTKGQETQDAEQLFAAHVLPLWGDVCLPDLLVSALSRLAR